MRRLLRGDRGSSAVFFVVLAPALLALLGLVLDGGRAIFDRQQAGDVALEAARVAANQCDLRDLYDLTVPQCEVINTVQACARAQDYIAAQHPVGNGVQGGVKLSMTSCTGVDRQADGGYKGFSITVRATAPTTLISIVGINEINVQSTQTARTITQAG